MNRYWSTALLITILLIQVGCDQISKQVVRHNLPDKQQIQVLHHYILLIKVENKGAFLSLGHSLPDKSRQLLLVFFPLLLLFTASICMIFYKNITLMTRLGIAFLIGGGIGNLTDRILYGSVTDFLHINLEIFKTGIFNMADISIMIGTLILIFDRFLIVRLGQSRTSDH